MNQLILLFLCLFLSLPCSAQRDSLPYAAIEEYPDDYGPGNVLARMIDALGFRYYWASKDLRKEDLVYRPSEEARSGYETLEHIYGLSEMIVNAPRGDTMVRPEDWSSLTYPELRKRTLARLAAASALYRGMTSDQLGQQKVMFSYGGQYSEYSLWYLINGPLADAIYHTGQLVTFRRTTGNPTNPLVNQFRGKLQE